MSALNTVRLCFSKTGRAKYISHLDLTRTMTRVIRRAWIPLWYTEGFNRHPYITFAAPLSLGYEGLRESMDLRLEEELPMEELVGRMNAAAPEGIRFLSAAPAVMKAGELTSARYRIAFAGESGGCGKALLERFLQQEAMPVEKRTKKGGVKTVDIRPHLENPVLDGEEAAAVLEVTLPCSSALTLNPSLLLTALQAFSGDNTLCCTVVRINLFGPDGRTFC